MPTAARGAPLIILGALLAQAPLTAGRVLVGGPDIPDIPNSLHADGHPDLGSNFNTYGESDCDAEPAGLGAAGGQVLG